MFLFSSSFFIAVYSEALVVAVIEVVVVSSKTAISLILPRRVLEGYAIKYERLSFRIAVAIAPLVVQSEVGILFVLPVVVGVV